MDYPDMWLLMVREVPEVLNIGAGAGISDFSSSGSGVVYHVMETSTCESKKRP